MMTLEVRNPDLRPQAAIWLGGWPMENSVNPSERPNPSDHIAPRAGAVLVVEDNEDLREALRQLLEIEGFSARTARNGREATEFLQLGEPVALILLDLMMPVMDGWEFRRLQLASAYASIPVVVMTALGANPQRATELGAASIVKKPLNFVELIGTVERFAIRRGGPTDPQPAV